MFVAVVQESGHHGLEEAVFLGRKPNLKLSPGYVAHHHRQLGDDLDDEARSPDPQFRNRAVNGGKEDTFGLHRQASAVSASAGVAEACGTADTGSSPTVQCGDRLGDAPPAPSLPYPAKERPGHDGEDHGGIEVLPHGHLLRLGFPMIKIVLSLPLTSGPAPQNNPMALSTHFGRTPKMSARDMTLPPP
ncbi:hypothetical protein OHB54_45150 [Streptomyces sp. NBC_01007]|nr:hypothetical protein OHB54_45150 [Streptomyces sp. NBC_01007]